MSTLVCNTRVMRRDIASQVVRVIRSEKKLRSGRLRQADPNTAWEQWLFTDLPFINEMCLILLVAIRHRVERELITLAARANGGSTVPRKQYQQNVMDQRKRLMAKDGWRNLIALLKLRSFPEWERSMKTPSTFVELAQAQPLARARRGAAKAPGTP